MLAPEAERWFRHAAPARSAAPCQARFGLALALLAQGDFRRGWQEYEVRWSDPAFAADEPAYAVPAWRGEPPAGRTILLHAEQGLGDTLQFVRYAPLVRARGARVVLEVQPPLVALLAGLADVVVGAARPLPAFDLHCPLLSLPLAFGTELDTIPADIPYLRVPPERLARLVGAARRPATAAAHRHRMLPAIPRIRRTRSARSRSRVSALPLPASMPSCTCCRQQSARRRPRRAEGAWCMRR